MNRPKLKPFFAVVVILSTVLILYPGVHVHAQLTVNSPDKSEQILNGQIDRKALERAVQDACSWLINIAQKKEKDLNPREINFRNYPYTNWKGVIKGEYISDRTMKSKDMGPRSWSFTGTIWHTGQAVKGLSLAFKYFEDDRYLKGAKLAAEFILNQQITDTDSEDYGFIYAYEGTNKMINTSCLLECCDGLFTLSEVSGEEKYARRAADAIRWTVKKLYMGNGLFWDGYIPEEKKVTKNIWPSRKDGNGRPLLDDGVLLKAYQYTGEEIFKKPFYETADFLLGYEYPEGNWINVFPGRWKEKHIHPRHAFWWGRPMGMAYLDSKEKKYQECFDRACKWYVDAFRADGGMIRTNYLDGKTTSFHHATSATACACMMFHDQYVYHENKTFVPSLVKGLKYMMMMQVKNAVDPNMEGVIIDRILPPNNSDRRPWYIRDIGTSFFISTASLCLMNINE